MSKCIKCEKTINDEPKLYGVIEKYHYDNRMTTADFDTGITTYKAVAIIKSAICEECLKKERKKLLLEGLKYIGIGILVIIVGSVAINLIDAAASVIALAGLITMIYGIGKAIKAFEKKEIIESAFDGKINKDFIIWPKNEDEISITELEYSTYYRNRYYYKLIDEKKLRRPIKIKGKKQSKVYAINTLKKALLAVESGADASLDALNPNINTDNLVKEDKHEKVNNVKTDKKRIVDIIKNKKIRRIVLGVFVGLAVLGISIVVINNSKVPTINLNDFIEIEEHGCDGAGYLDIKIDTTRLYNYYNDDIRFRNRVSSKGVSNESQKEFLEYCAKMKDHTDEYTFLDLMEFINYDHSTNLKNGDVVYYEFNDNLSVIDKVFKCKFEYLGGTYTMSNLPERKDIDFFSVLDNNYLKFEGINGDGKANFSYINNGENTIYEDNDCYIVSKPDEVNSFILYSKEGKQLKQMNMFINNYEHLSNGDVVTIEFSSGIEGFADYGFVPKRASIDVAVTGLGNYIDSGKVVNRQMLKDYIIKQEAEQNNIDISEVEVNIRSAIFFKMPEEYRNGEDIIICVDYDTSHDVNHEIENAKLGMIYNPIVGNELSADRFDVDFADNMYNPLEEEFEIVDVNIDIKDYGQLLEVMASNKMKLLTDVGLEDADYVNTVIYCFINDDTYYIVD